MSFKISDLVKKGINSKIPVVIPSISTEPLDMAPLSRGQWGEIEDLEASYLGDIENVQKENSRPGRRQRSKRQIESELKMKMDPAKQSKGTRISQTRAIFLSLSPHDKDLTEDDIQKVFNKKQFDDLYDKVREISGVEEDEEDEEVKCPCCGEVFTITDDEADLEEKVKNFPED